MKFSGSDRSFTESKEDEKDKNREADSARAGEEVSWGSSCMSEK